VPAYSVVLIEDDSAIREAIHGLLAMEGYAVSSVRDGVEALALTDTADPPSVIILDLMLPRLHGRQFLQILKERQTWKNVPVIVLSAGDMSDVPVSDREAILMSKPVDADMLLEKVRSYCKGARHG
jgi:DNA-binding response OmpR family regulator